MLSEPLLSISGISRSSGITLNTDGVKLFSGIADGNCVPIGETEISGLITLIIVPGVVAGMTELFEGITNRLQSGKIC